MSDMREFVATPTVEELEAEIERLEADAENLRNTITSTHLSLKERDAEIERLKREWDEDLKSVTLQWEVWEESDKAKDAKIKRLRNGLELIADPGDITSVEELGHIARFYLQESK